MLRIVQWTQSSSDFSSYKKRKDNRGETEDLKSLRVYFEILLVYLPRTSRFHVKRDRVRGLTFNHRSLPTKNIYPFLVTYRTDSVKSFIEPSRGEKGERSRLSGSTHMYCNPQLSRDLSYSKLGEANFYSFNSHSSYLPTRVSVQQ